MVDELGVGGVEDGLGADEVVLAILREDVRAVAVLGLVVLGDGQVVVPDVHGLCVDECGLGRRLLHDVHPDRATTIHPMIGEIVAAVIAIGEN